MRHQRSAVLCSLCAVTLAGTCLAGSVRVLARLDAALCCGEPPPQYPSPVRELTGPAELQVGGAGFTEIAISSTDLKTAAAVTVSAEGKATKTSVDRGANAVSAVYAGVALPNALPSTPPPAEFSAPTADQMYGFKTSGNSAQGWATMRTSGMPFLLMRAFGKASASGTAAWMARVAVPGQQNHMYVRFTLPAIRVTGVNENEGPGRYQSRFRAELLLNGHPVWTSEATRLNEFSSAPAYCPTDQGELATRFQVFGVAPSGLSATDKNDASNLNPVTVALGAFPPGQVLDLSLVVRADSSIQGKCCFKANEYFCTGASATVDWSNSSNPVRFWAGPAI